MDIDTGDVATALFTAAVTVGTAIVIAQVGRIRWLRGGRLVAAFVVIIGLTAAASLLAIDDSRGGSAAPTTSPPAVTVGPTSTDPTPTGPTSPTGTGTGGRDRAALPDGYLGSWQGQGILNGDDFLVATLRLELRAGRLGEQVGELTLTLPASTCHGTLQLQAVEADHAEFMEVLDGICTGRSDVALYPYTDGKAVTYQAGRPGASQPSTQIILNRLKGTFTR